MPVISCHLHAENVPKTAAAMASATPKRAFASALWDGRARPVIWLLALAQTKSTNAVVTATAISHRRRRKVGTEEHVFATMAGMDLSAQSSLLRAFTTARSMATV